MKKKWLLLVTSILSLLTAAQVYAVCPLCTIAVGAGVGLSRWVGIDDTITGLWIGGLTVSLIIWTITWFNKKNWNFKFRGLIITAVYYLIIVVPLYYTEILGHPLNRLWGIDKLFLGTLIGSFAFWGGAAWYESLKRKNGGHAHFPFQKVVMPVVPLIILSLIFYFITK